MRTPYVALGAALALTLPTGAAPKPQITDPVGDALVGAGPGYDVVSALFTTSGTTVKAGRRLVYTPTKLVIVLTYAGTVATDQWAAQVVTFDAPGCTSVYLERFAAATYGRAACLGDDFEFTAKAAGRTLTFTLPFSVVGKERLRKGAVLTRLRTYTAFADPVLGYETGEAAGVFGAGVVDEASTTAGYPIG